MRGEASEMDTQSSECADRKHLTALMGHFFDVPPTSVVFTIEIIRSKLVMGGQQLDQSVCVCVFVLAPLKYRGLKDI